MATFRLLSRGPRELVSVLFASAIALTARASFADHYIVPSGSMEPTVQVEDRVLVDKLAYGLRIPLTDVYLARFAPPSRGDVVVLTSPESGTVLLKRVVAVGGDLVRVHDGEVEINGKTASIENEGGTWYERLGPKPHALNLDNAGGPNFGPVVVPKGEMLVLGDNRGNSHDGRSFGFVGETAILGHAKGVFLRNGKVTWVPL
jgi:signal peptidase I